MAFGSFALAIPFFSFLGYGDVLRFSSLIGFAMLVPLIGAQFMILLLALYFFKPWRYQGCDCHAVRGLSPAEPGGLISITGP